MFGEWNRNLDYFRLLRNQDGMLEASIDFIIVECEYYANSREFNSKKIGLHEINFFKVAISLSQSNMCAGDSIEH